MTSMKKPSLTKYEHSPQIFERRRSLFPPVSADSDEDSDVGPISPLSFDSSFEQDVESLARNPTRIESVGDYDILGIVRDDETHSPHSIKNSQSESVPSSPFNGITKSLSDSIMSQSSSTTLSPSYALKTPLDSSTKSKLPKLTRKTLLECPYPVSNKRKLSPYDSPKKIKQTKLDPKSSKVRTTLFPDLDISLPTKNFYSSTEDNIMDEIRNRKKLFPRSTIPVGMKRKSVKSRKRVGTINNNAGVRHSIRKPKQKKLNSSTSAKGSMSEVQTNAIKNYLEDLRELRSATEEKENILHNQLAQKQIIVTPKVSMPVNQNGNIAIEVTQKQIIMPPLSIPVRLNDRPKANENETSNKRSLSPTSVEPDQNKKFFKSSRVNKGVVTMNKYVKIQVANCKVILKDENSSKPVFAPNDFLIDEEEEPAMPETNIDNILSLLDESENAPEQSNVITLQAHNSVISSDRSILLHDEPANSADLILSPISQMCDVTSGLALNSPKKGKNLSEVLDKMPNRSDIKKVFPIFDNPNSGFSKKNEGKTIESTEKKFRKLGEDQMLLDAGQKRFGVTHCSHCNFVYHMGDPGDEIMHASYHEAAHILRFGGWKCERIVTDFQDNGRIIHIVPGDSKLWWKRVKDLMEFVNRELGCYDMEFKLDDSQVFLYIKNRAIVGCLVAVAKSEGHKMLTTKEDEADLCSETAYPIKCGVTRIWVSNNYRQQGVGTKLMNALKKRFIFDHMLTNADIAISPPTEMGKNFAKKYFRTPNYMIYY